MKPLLSLLLALGFVQCSAQISFEFHNIDMVPGQHSKPSRITSIGNKLYMRAENEPGDAQPWVSDGTPAGTMLLKTIYAGSGSYPSDFTAVNGKVIFEVRDSSKGYYPWVTDGTPAGTKRLALTQNPDFFTLYNNKVYYAAESGYGIEMFVTDGTDTGTHLFKDIYAGGKSSAPWPYHTYNGKLYFGAYDDNGKELWVTDGTDTGTHIVKDIYKGGAGSFPNSFAELSGRLLFFAGDSAHGNELWITDGTDTGTHLVKDIWPGKHRSSNYTYASIAHNGYLYFTATDSAHGHELWRTDGTEAGTTLVKDIYPGTVDGLALNIFAPVVYKNKIYFAATDDTAGVELWSTDGTEAGTKMVVDIRGWGHSEPRSLTVYKNTLIFVANLSDVDAEIFTSDGTAAGTAMLYPKDGKLTDPVNTAKFNGFTYHAADSNLYFAASYDHATGIELWYLKGVLKTGIANAVVAQPGFSIYPNPANGNFTIELQDTDFKNASITVYNLLGASVYQSPITNGKSQITLNQPAGIYFVKLQVDDAVLTKRLVVELKSN